MRRLVISVAVLALALPLSSCEQILLSPLKKWGDRVEEQREKRTVHPFELFLTTTEPELDYLRFYGESQDVKTTLDPTPSDWFELSSTPNDAFRFSLERRYAEFTDNTYCTVDIYLNPTEGVPFKLNTKYHFGDVAGRKLDGYLLDDSFMELWLVNYNGKDIRQWDFLSTYGWIEFTALGSNPESNNPFVYDGASVIDAKFYFETVDPETGELLLRAEDCLFRNCWGSAYVQE